MHSLRAAVFILALLSTPVSFASIARAQSAALEVVELRTDTYPRIVARLRDVTDDQALERPFDRARVAENGQPQPSAELLQLRNPALATSVVLAIDTSGSMADEEKLVQAQASAKRFIEQMRPRVQIALVSYGDDVNVPQQLTRDRKLLGRAIDQLTPAGNTRLYDGVAQSLTQLSLAPSSARAVVLLTDGQDTASLRNLDDDVAQAVRDGVPVYTIG